MGEEVEVDTDDDDVVKTEASVGSVIIASPFPVVSSGHVRQRDERITVEFEDRSGIRYK